MAVLLEVLKPEETDVDHRGAGRAGRVRPGRRAGGPGAPPDAPAGRSRLGTTGWRSGVPPRSAGSPRTRRPPTRRSSFLVEFFRAASSHGPLHYRAADALGEFGPAAAEVVPNLIELLTEGPSAVRIPAVTALGRIAPGTPHETEAVETLVESLHMSPDSQGTTEIIEALARFGRKADVAIPRLKELELAANKEVRIAAQKAPGHAQGSTLMSRSQLSSSRAIGNRCLSSRPRLDA